MAIIKKDLNQLTRTELAAVAGSFFVNVSANSKRTGKEYHRDVADFFEFLKDKGVVLKNYEDLTRQHVIAYREHLDASEMAKKTILRKLSAISSFLKFLAEEGLVNKDITYGVARPKSVNDRETADFTERQVKAMLEACNTSKLSGLLHRAILGIGFYCGLRNEEIRTLRVEDYGRITGHNILKVHGKGGEPREIPLNPRLLEYLDEYLTAMERAGRAMRSKDPLFQPARNNANGILEKRLHHNSVTYIVNKYARLAGVPMDSIRRISPHSMRATFIGHLINVVKAPMEQVQRLAGHKSPKTTQLYDKRPKSHDGSPVYQIKYE